MTPFTFATRSFLSARRRPSLAWVLALVFFLATPFAPAPWAVNLAAQTFTHNTTTTAAAQTATDTTLVLTSVSAASGSSFGAVQVGHTVLVDQEPELVTAIASTTLTVQRRAARTAHASGAPVYVGPGNAFQLADPPAGACTTANQPKWWINLNTGGVFTCGPNSIWARSNAPWLTPFQSGNGATVTLTAGQSGQTLLFDRAAGIVYTLPPPFPGMTFDFVYTTTITSNAGTVVTAAGTQFIVGVIHTAISGGATGSDWACNGTSHIKVTSNGTTSGGILGGRLHFTAVSTTLWQVDGLLIGSGTEVTPCST
jgi:hypothetical protein